MPVNVREGGLPPPPELIEALDGLDLPTIGHFLELGFTSPAIRRLTGTGLLVGRAVTVRVVAPDSALVHRAAEHLGPGDVLVVDLGGARRHAPVGAVVAEAVTAAGAIGIVVDGPVTDSRELHRLPLSVYARGTSALTTKLHALDAGGINVPVSVDGVPVLPGYVVIGDDDGLLLTDPADVMAVVERARRAADAEPAKLDRIRAGSALTSVSAAGERLKAVLGSEDGGGA